ncbi:DUF4143 domain-containing protein [Rickettsiales endosymbiont of Peranema trichophorum]|uniref:DUF4143 domain-containing protein n=1 Tax=Rickettsiales endosymbiont of Peranema trichophorum TaxID=2486577 RepID=UPI00397AAC08
MLTFGGFPEPILKQEASFLTQWSLSYQELLIQYHLKNFSKLQHTANISRLINALHNLPNSRLSCLKLSIDIPHSPKTISSWVQLLQNFYYCFIINPWNHNISYALTHEPRLYLLDWSNVVNPELKLKTLVASHLFKAIHFWNEFCNGQYSLFYIRNKQKKEVDFLITQNLKPWLLIHVDPFTSTQLNDDLLYFHSKLNTSYALQLAPGIPYIDCDFRELKSPKIFPITTFLSQLI